MKVELSEKEWVALLNCAALAPYNIVHPLIKSVSEQLMAQGNVQPPETQREVSG